MKEEDRYHRFVRWSDEDHVYLGFCPDLYWGGVCHAESEEECSAELCQIVRDEVAHRLAKSSPLHNSARRLLKT